ncbi:MAG: DNA translocase FtsK [Anaerolineae bacterium]|jgi:S-DNA-T family DNA segregation ATPase FtsK/SpoIIIE
MNQLYNRTQQEPIDVTAGFLQATLGVQGVASIVSPLWDGPQIQTFKADLAVGVRPEKIERLDGALAVAAGVSTCRVSRGRGFLLIEIPKPPEERKALRAKRLLRFRSDNPWRVPLGVSTVGEVVWLDLSDERTCHAVLGGTTGSGKTNLLHWALFRLLAQTPPRQLGLLLMDPKGYELQPFAQARHLIHPPEYRSDEILKVLLWIEETMAQRSREHVTQPRILLVIDEVRELVEREGRVERILASIAQIGRGLGIHLLVTTQQPGAKALGDALPNFPVRLLGRVASATLSYGAAGRARSQANMLLGRGDFLLLTQDYELRFQAPLMDAGLLETLPTTDEVSRLDLPESLDLKALTTAKQRGGHNRKPLDLAEVRRLVVEERRTAAQLSHELSIYYERAQRLVEMTRAIALGADAAQISYQFDVPRTRAERLVEELRGDGYEDQ